MVATIIEPTVLSGPLRPTEFPIGSLIDDLLPSAEAQNPDCLTIAMVVSDPSDSESECGPAPDTKKPAAKSATGKKATQPQSTDLATSNQKNQQQLAQRQSSTALTTNLIRGITKPTTGAAFDHMFTALSITNTYHANGNIASEHIDAALNMSRIQCSRCRAWFADNDGKKTHNRRFPSGCDVHKQCFAPRENVMHAKHHVHDRCFVRECVSKYSEEDGWGHAEVERHVREVHGFLKMKE